MENIRSIRIRMEVECRVRGDRTVLNYNKRQLQDVSCLESTDEESCKSIQVSTYPFTLLENE